MAFRANQYFNDPAFGQAAANLAQLFAPPSGADAAGWATANAKREEAARLAQLFELAQAGEFDQSLFDRLGMAAGQWNPNQSFYSVDQGNAVTMRGQDVDASTRLRMNEADNTRALTTNRLDNQTRAVTGLYGSLAPGHVRPEVPEDLAEIIFGPGAGPVGAVSGAPAQPSRSEVEGSILQSMSPEEQQAIIFGNTPVENIVTDEGPRIATRRDSVGQEPFFEPSDRAPNPRMYRTPDGRGGVTHDGGLTDAHSGEPLPQGTQVTTSADTTETFGAPEMREHRGEILNRRAAVESMIQQANTIDELLANTDTGSAIGAVGSAARVINDLASQVQAVAQLGGIETDIGIRDTEQYTDMFRSLGIDNATVQSALVDLAYTVAQSRKPGRLNQDDIRQALRTIGGNLQDPVALRHVLNSAVQRSMSDYQAFERTMRDQFGDSLNLVEPNFTPMRGSPRDAGPAPQGEAESDGWTTLPDGTRVRERR